MNWLQKYAAQMPKGMVKTAQSFSNCTFNGPVTIAPPSADFGSDKYSLLIHNNDRYGSDTHRMWVFKTATTNGISLAFELRNERNGNLTYSDYWHYDKHEGHLADGVMKHLIKSSEKIKEIVEKEHTPLPLVATFFREASIDLDLPHKERSIGAKNFNEYLVSAKPEQDWRETLYGTRYPEMEYPGVMEDTFKNLSKDNKGKTVKTEGTTSRNTVTKYKYE